MVSISIASTMGGVGKTTLAVNLADVLSREKNMKVFLIDMDPGSTDATRRLLKIEGYSLHTLKCYTMADFFGLPHEGTDTTVSDLPNNQTLTSDAVTPVEIKKNFHLLPGDFNLSRLHNIISHKKTNLLKQYIDGIRSSEKYDFVILDTPPFATFMLTSALLASDYYIIPVTPGPYVNSELDYLKETIEKKTTLYGINSGCLGLLVTMAEEDSFEYHDTVAAIDRHDTWKGKTFSTPLQINFQNVQTRYDKLILDSDNAPAAAAISKIAKEILDRIDRST